MPHLRIIVAWLIMLALPLQGVAAAAMVHCAGDRQSAHVSAVDGAPAHDAATHAHDAATHAHGPAAVAQDALGGDDGSGVLAAAAHKCGACASGCHGVAIMDSRCPTMSSPPEQADLVEPSVHFGAILAAPPDKPPRA